MSRSTTRLDALTEPSAHFISKGKMLSAMDPRLVRLAQEHKISVAADATLPECLSALSHDHLGLALVLDPKTSKPIGMLDAASILQAILQGCQPLECTAQKLMRACGHLIAQPRNPSDALKWIEERQSYCLIFVDEKGVFQGIITSDDLLSRDCQRLREHTRHVDAVLDDMRGEMRDYRKESAEVMGMLAHDLRGPLGGIQSICLLLAKDGATMPLPQIKEFSQLVAEQADNLLNLTKDVLELTRNAAGTVPLKTTTCDPVVLLETCCTLYKQLAKSKGIEFTLEKSPQPAPMIIADPERLRIVLSNLLDNAVKYCAAGHKIRAAIEHTSYRVSFIVSDNGQGVPKEELSKLFIRFGRCSSIPTGGEASTGLGLAIAREIIHAHGGQISVTGDKGKGLTFRVTLPVHDQPPGGIAVSSASARRI